MNHFIVTCFFSGAGTAKLLVWLGLSAGWFGCCSLAGARVFSAKLPDWLRGTPNLLGALFLKCCHEAHHSPYSNDVKTGWSCSVRPIRFKDMERQTFPSPVTCYCCSNVARAPVFVSAAVLMCEVPYWQILELGSKMFCVFWPRGDELA